MTFWDHLTEDEKKASVDRTCSREFRDGSAWEAAGRVKKKWDEDVYPNLKAFLNEKHKDLNPTSRKMAIYSIVCWMVGKEWHLSHPATVFVCGTKKVAKRALKQIECFLKLGNSGFRAYTHIAAISLNCGVSGQDPSGKIGLCGTLVNVGNFREAFERQTTVGGVVHIDGYDYCMTAAHPFLSVDEDGDDGDDDNDVGNESLDEDSGVGDNNTIENKRAIPYDDDALNRKSFLSQRFDWALLKVSDECEPALNTINVPGGILIPWKISTTSPKTPLWAATGTHKAVEIQSTPTLSGICLDDSGILDVWTLKMMSYPGDSGSWVVDPHDDSIVAIVIARCEALNATYALSARDVFNDIARNIGQTIDLTVADNGSLLALAAKQGKADLVEEILRPAIDLNSKNERERTAMYDNALLEASAEGHEKIIQLLLENGADVNAQGGSALLAASKEGHDKIIQLLLDHGADVNAQGGSASALLNSPADLTTALNPEAHQSASLYHARYTPTYGTLRSRKTYSINEESRGVYRPLLAQRYQAQRSPDSFFVVGRVFGILWHEDKGQQGTVISDNISQVQSTQSQSTQSQSTQSQSTQIRFREEVFSSIQHMVVVKAMSQYAWCSPITTYNGKGVAKPGVNPAEHAIIYMQGSVPTCKADEPQMTKEPLEVEPARPGERLNEMSRLNFGKVYPVEHNVKVHHVGIISRTSMDKFRGYASKALRFDI
ncbi:hypothetical protein CNMCM8980_009584 [Aspergillus fumigatiaffinis]|nr:hypothetical protein CNMCM8980_009584 [Aspergillus fumigatiaffinis]